MRIITHINRLRLLVIILPVALIAGEWHNPQFPAANREKPLWQWNGWPPPGRMWIGGRCYPVRLPDPETIDQAKLRIQIAKLESDIKLERDMKKSGREKMEFGITVLVCGIMAAVILAHWGWGLVGISIAGYGLSRIMAGAITMELADKTTAIVIGSVIFFIIVVAVVFTAGRGLRIDHVKKLKGFPWRTKK